MLLVYFILSAFLFLQSTFADDSPLRLTFPIQINAENGSTPFTLDVPPLEIGKNGRGPPDPYIDVRTTYTFKAMEYREPYMSRHEFHRFLAYQTSGTLGWVRATRTPQMGSLLILAAARHYITMQDLAQSSAAYRLTSTLALSHGVSKALRRQLPRKKFSLRI